MTDPIQGPDPSDLRQWQAFFFGKGDWHLPTENRESPPKVKAGDQITIGEDLSVEIMECHLSRLLKVKFLSSNLHQNLYRYGKPIQYSYLNEELAVWDQQTIFSGPPISVEPPSASFPFTWDLIFALQEKGIQITDILPAVAFIYSVYSLSCFYLRKPTNSTWLKAIALANLAYCLATAVILVIFYAQLVTIGFVYFLAEIAIILGLANFELKLAGGGSRQAKGEEIVYHS